MPEEVKYEMSLNDLVSPKLEQAEHHAKKFELSLHSVKEGLVSLGERAMRIGETLGISFAFIKLEEFFHQGVEIAHQLAQAEAQLKAGIISTNEAAGISFEELEESARKFSKTLPYSRAQIMDMQAQLLTFPGVTKKVFDEASESIFDMSTRLHKGLDETAIMVGKALQDPMHGITAMRRVGVNFNEEQTKVIKNLVETGHVGKAQALILKELQTEFAGSAKAAADSDPLFRYNKLMGSIKVSIGEAGEALLHDVTPALETAVEWFKTGYNAVSDFLGYLRDHGPAILKEVKDDVEAVAIGVGVAGAAFVAANPGVIAYGASLVIDTITSSALAVATGVLTAAQWLLNAAMSANPVGIVIVAIAGLVTGIVIAYHHSAKFRAVLAGIGEVAKDVWSILKGLGEAILGIYLFNPKMIAEGINTAVSGVKDISHAFNRGYDESMAESAKAELEEKKKEHETALGRQAKKPNAPKPAGTTAKTPQASKVSGTKTVNIHVQIGNLVNDFKIITNNIKESPARVHDIVTKALTDAVNDSQIIADAG